MAITSALTLAALGCSDAESGDGFAADELVILVGHATGGGADTISRVVQPYLQDALGIPVVVENVGGAGGMVASQQAYQSEPDGSTILAVNFPSYMLNEVYGDGDAPPFREFSYVYQMTANDSNGLAVHPDSDLATWEDFTQVAGERQLFYAAASGANNLSNSTPGEALILEHEGIEFEHIPYDSGGEAAQAVIGGHADVTIAALSTLRRLGDELTTIAYFAEEGMSEFDEAGAVRFGEIYDDAHYDTGLGFLGPPDMPEDILEHLIAAFDEVVANEEFTSSLQETAVPAPLPGPEFEASITAVYDQVEELRPAIESVTYQD